MRSLRIFAFLVTLLSIIFIASCFNASPETSLILGLIITFIGSRVRLPAGILAAGLADTAVTNYLANYAGRIDKNEQRQSEYGAWDLFLEQSKSPTGILDPATQAALENAWAPTTQIPVLNYRDVTITNVRTCAIQTGGPTSALMTVTFVTYAFGFPMFPALHGNNQISYDQAFAKNMQVYEQKLAATLDAAAVAKLESSKNQYWPAAITGAYYPVTANALQVPLAAHEDFFNQLQSIMGTMDYYGNMYDVTNNKGMAQVRKWAAQGQGNQTNLAFQFGGTIFKVSNRVVNAAGAVSTHYVVAPDSVAVVRRLDPDVIMGSSVGTQKQWSVSPTLPLIGLDFGLYYNEDCTDASAIQPPTSSRLTRTKVESFEFSADIAFIASYNSRPTLDYSPIVKAELLST
jgi:hypothetical protein